MTVRTIDVAAMTDDQLEKCLSWQLATRFSAAEVRAGNYEVMFDDGRLVTEVKAPERKSNMSDRIEFAESGTLEWFEDGGRIIELAGDVDQAAVTRPNDDGRCPAMLLDEYTSTLDQCALPAGHGGACSLVKV